MPPQTTREYTRLNSLERNAHKMSTIVDTYLGQAGPERDLKIAKLNRHKRPFYNSFVISTLRIYDKDPDQELRNRAANDTLGDLEAQIDAFVQSLNGIMKPEAIKAALALEIKEVLVAGDATTPEIIETFSEDVPWKANQQVKAQFESLAHDPDLVSKLNKLYKLSSDASASEILGEQVFNTNPKNAPHALIELKNKIVTLRGEITSQAGTPTAPNIIDPFKNAILSALSRQIEKLDHAINQLMIEAILNSVDGDMLPRVTELLNRKAGGATLPENQDELIEMLSYLRELDIEYKKVILDLYPGLEQKIVNDIATNANQLVPEANTLDKLTEDKQKILSELDVIQSTLNQTSAQMNDMKNNDLDTGNSEANQQALDYFQATTARLDILSRTIDGIDQTLLANAALAPTNMKYLERKSAYLADWAADLAKMGRPLPAGVDLVTAHDIITDVSRAVRPDTKNTIQNLYIQARELKEALDLKIKKRFKYLENIKQKLPDVESEARKVESQTNAYDILKLEETLKELTRIINETSEQDTTKFPELQMGIRLLERELVDASKALIMAEGDFEQVNLEFTDLVAKHKHTRRELARIAANFPGKLELREDRIVSIALTNLQQLLEGNRQEINTLQTALNKLKAKYDKRIAYTLVDDIDDAKVINSKFVNAIGKEKGAWLKDIKGQLHFFDNSEETGPFILKLANHPAADLLDGKFDKVIAEIEQVLTATNYKGNKKKLITKIIRNILGDNFDLVPYDLVFTKFQNLSWAVNHNLSDIFRLGPNTYQNMLTDAKNEGYPAYRYLENRLRNLRELSKLVGLTNLREDQLNPDSVSQTIEEVSLRLIDLKAKGITNKDEYHVLGVQLMALRRIAEFLKKIDPKYYVKQSIAPTTVSPTSPTTPPTTNPVVPAAPATPAAAPQPTPVAAPVASAVVPGQPIQKPTASGTFVPIGLANQPKVGPEIPFDEVPDNGKPVSPEVLDPLDLDLVNDQKPIAEPTVPDASSGTDSDALIPFDDITGTTADTATSVVPAEAVTQIMPDQIQLDPIPNKYTVETERNFNRALNDFGGRLRIPFYKFVTDPETWTKLAQGGEINPDRTAAALHKYIENDTELVASPAYQFLEIHLARAAVDMHNLNQEYQIDYGIMNARNDMIALGFNTPTDTPKNIKKREDIGYYLAKRFGISPIYTILSEPKGTLDNVSYQDLIRLFNSKFSKAVEALDITDTDPAAIEAKLETISIPDKPKNSPAVIKMLARVISNKNKNAAAATTEGQLPEAPTTPTVVVTQPAAPAQESPVDADEIGISDILAPNTTDPLGKSPAIAGLEAMNQLEDDLANEALGNVDIDKLKEDLSGINSIPAIQQTARRRIKEANPGASERTIDRAESELVNRLRESAESEESLPDNISQQPVQAQTQDNGPILEPVRNRANVKPWTELTPLEGAQLNQRLQGFTLDKLPPEELLNIIGLNREDLEEAARNALADGKVKDIASSLVDMLQAMMQSMNLRKLRTEIPSALKPTIEEVVNQILPPTTA